MKLNANLVKSTVVAALGGLLFGFDTAVIAGTTHALTVTFHAPRCDVGQLSPRLRRRRAHEAEQEPTKTR
jgi:hypothetical protein